MEIRRSRLHIHFAFHIERQVERPIVSIRAFPKVSLRLMAVLLKRTDWTPRRVEMHFQDCV